jgi:hypothetical protein
MSQSSRDDKAQVALAFAADYLEVLATARSGALAACTAQSGCAGA